MEEKILDAPNITADEDFHIIDIGKTSGYLALCIKQEVYLWNENQTNTLFKQNQLNISEPKSVQWMNSVPNLISVGFTDGSIQLWDVERNIQYRTFQKMHQGTVSNLEWTNTYVLSSGGMDGMIMNNDIRQKKSCISQIKAHQSNVSQLKASPFYNSILASGGNDGLFQIWDLQYPQSPRFVSKIHKNEGVKGLEWCPWQKNLIATAGGKKLKFWNCENFELQESLQLEDEVCGGILWNPCNKEILSCHGQGKNYMRLWNTNTFQKVVDFYGHLDKISHIRICPDKEKVCTISSDETLRLWKAFQIQQQINDDIVSFEDQKYFFDIR